jgi:hypothetical protein
MRVSLSELDRRWEHIRAGTIYHGEAVAPRNTSWFERMIGVCRVRPSHVLCLLPLARASQLPCLPCWHSCLHGGFVCILRTRLLQWLACIPLRAMRRPQQGREQHEGRLVPACGPNQAYNPKLDEEDLYQEKVPNWRIASMSRGSVSASPSARLTGDGVAAA